MLGSKFSTVPKIVRVMKSRGIRWVGRVACTAEYLKGKDQGRERGRVCWQDLEKQTVIEGLDHRLLQWLIVVSWLRISWPAEQLLVFSKDLAASSLLVHWLLNNAKSREVCETSLNNLIYKNECMCVCSLIARERSICTKRCMLIVSPFFFTPPDTSLRRQDTKHVLLLSLLATTVTIIITTRRINRIGLNTVESAIS
jgi:hypothetical protein